MRCANRAPQIWELIANRYAIEMAGDNFWEWILAHPEIPAVITEGEKKALSGLSASFVTVSLPGIDSGYKSILASDGESKSLELIPDLIALGQGGREIYIAFDRDSNPQTIQRVARSTQKLAKLFGEMGCETFSIQWGESFKGLDDFIANSKPREVEQAIATAANISPKAKPASASTVLLTSFESSIERGLEQISLKDDGQEERESIGNHLQAVAYVNNPEQDGAALLLEFQSIRGGLRFWTIPRAELAGDGVTIVGGLMGRNYDFKRRQKQLLLDYLHGLGSKVEVTFVVTDSSGWVGKSFVLPHKTYGDENLKFRDVIPSPDAITEVKGTLQGWKDGIAARCGGNSRLILGLGISFATPLLPIVDIESGGFHLVGDTSQGKTTILSVAASVTGLKDIPKWRTTINGLESIATSFNHLCLPLDEIGEADPREVGGIAYMLANGQGKARMKRDLTNRKSKTWRLMVLSSGEVSLRNYMKQGNLTQKGGQEVRLPDVPAVPFGSQYGCFETIHQASIGEQFVSALEAEVRNHRGIALDEFLSRLVRDVAHPQFAGGLAKQMYLISASLAEGTVDSAIRRVAKRFALVQVALGLAHKYGLLPFPVSHIEWAITTCFKDWLRVRGGDGSIEVKNAIERIEHLFVTNEFSDRVFTLPNNNDRVVRNLLAYRTVDFEGNTEEFWVPTSVFDKEFCEGVNKAELVKELQRTGWLLPPRPDGKSIHQRKIKGKPSYYYVFPVRVFGSEAGEAGEAGASNDCVPDVSAIDTRFTTRFTGSEAGEASHTQTNVTLHSLHGREAGSEAGGGRLNDDTPSDSDTASPASPASLPKIHQPSSKKEVVGKVLDRVYIPNRDAHGTITRIFLDEPKGQKMAEVRLEKTFEIISLLLEFAEIVE